MVFDKFLVWLCFWKSISFNFLKGYVSNLIWIQSKNLVVYMVVALIMSYERPGNISNGSKSYSKVRIKIRIRIKILL